MASVLLMGKGDLALGIGQWFLNNDWDVTAVPVMPEPEWTGSFRDWAGFRSVPVLESHNEALPHDLALSVYYDKIISGEWLAKQSVVLNLHNAPLPRYRGVNPINWALKNGEREHGVTIHIVEEDIDSGPIVAQEIFPIDPAKDEVRDVYERCLQVGWDLFVALMPEWRERVAVARVQDEGLATYYNKDDAAGLGERSGWTRQSSS